MTLKNARAAFEKAVTDEIATADPKVVMVYDNVPYTLPSKTTKYIYLSLTFNRSTFQTHGAASDFYSGTIQCNIFVPKNAGTTTLATLGEAVIDGLISVNATGYTDTYSCKPRVSEVSGPIPVELEDNSHFMAIISCQFSANA